MHEDAANNYSSPWGWERHAPNDLTWNNSRVKVLSLWNDTRYAEMTGDTRFEHRTPELVQALGARLAANTPQDWDAMLQGFEENGWYGSPTTD